MYERALNGDFKVGYAYLYTLFINMKVKISPIY